MALIIPLPSVTATTTTSISLLGTAASGGTAPYTYQWYRTLSAAGVYSVVAGATSLTLADTGLSAEQEYSYSLRATDAAAATGYSVQVIGFTAQAAFDTNGADAGLTGIVAGGAGGSTTVTAHAAAQSFTESSTNPLQGDLTGALRVYVGTLITYRNISLNAVGYSIKASPGSLFGYYITNLSASVRFIKLYNKASAPVVGTDIPMATLAISAGVTVNMRDAAGIAFSNGIAIAATNLVADTDTTSPAANDVVANVYYV